MRAAARAVLLVLTVLAAVLAAGGAASAADDTARYAADHVVVVGVPGLTWDDVGARSTPQLWDLAQDAPIGALSVRAARSTTCLIDGWATLGAGNRARYPADEDVPVVTSPGVPLPDDPAAPSGAPGAGTGTDDGSTDATLTGCELQEQVAATGLTDPAATVARIAEDGATARFGAEPGALGTAVGCAGVVGRAAATAVAGEDVDVRTTDDLPADPAAVAALMTDCPLTLVSLDELTSAAQPADAATGTGGTDGTDDEDTDATARDAADRAAALAVVDAAVGRVRAAVATLPGRTLLLVVGVSEVGVGRPQLHPVIASGPGFPAAGWLTSSSTGRSPFAQLIDVAPTVLRALGTDEPASMNGQPLQDAGSRPALGEAVAELDAMNTAASAHYRSTSEFFWTLVGVNAVVVALGLVVLGGWRRGSGRRLVPARRREALRVLALAVAALPIATYLADLVPWERAGAPRLALAAAVLGADLVLLAVALLGPWRRRRLGPPLAVLAGTLGTLIGDVVTGSHLELDGLLGYDPIVAGRFTGYGNLTFGLLSTSALLGTAAVATAVGRRVRPEKVRRAVGGTVLGLGVLTVGVIGAPQLGRDFGGVLAAVPGFLLLAMLLTRTRVTVTRLAAILGAAVLVVGTVAFLDWLRPAGERSHLGRFVQQLIDGEAWTVISRKAEANVNILLGSALAWMLPVALVAALWLVRRGGLLRGGSGGPAGGLPVADVGVLRSGLIAVAASLTLGAAVNDSGIAVPATAAALLVPLLVWLAAAPRGAGVGEGTPGSATGEGSDRVTVVSRGSTVWNA